MTKLNIEKKQERKCSICGEIRKLTYDHVPPRSCGNAGKSMYIAYTPEYLSKDGTTRKKYTQNGVKFKTICDKCNNYLGSQYDVELIKFRESVLAIIDGKKTSIEFEIEKVVKCIIGHFIAASEYEDSVPSRDMRKYYLTNDLDFKSKYSLYCFYYPFKQNIFVLKNYCVLKFKKNIIDYPVGIISSLYFYPFAFIICDKQSIYKNNDMIRAIEGNIFCISENDWVENGLIKHPTWPAIVNENQGFVISKSANESVYKN